MANQTITVDTNHDTLTSRAAGEDITVNNGATLTIDSWVTKTSMGVMGDLTVNQGKVLIDGRNVKEIAYSSGSGTLPAIGDIVTDTNGGSGKVIWLTSGTATSGAITITQQSGTFAASSTISDSGTWSATIDTVDVGMLVYYGENQQYSGSGLATYEIKGDWYEIGTGTGSDSQTFTLPWSGGTQWGMWAETGSGTGLYERWVRIPDAENFTTYGTGDAGRVFKQTHATATITVGTSTNGGVVPIGAKVRIPNVHIGTTSTATPEIEVALDSTTAYWEFASNQGTTLDFDKVNMSSIRLGHAGSSISIQNSCCLIRTLISVPISFSMNNTIVSTDATRQGDIYAMWVQSSSDISITDCLFYSDDPTTSSVVLSIDISIDATLSNIICIHSNNGANGRVVFGIFKSTNLTATDLRFYGGRVNIADGTTNLVMTDTVYSATMTGTPSFTSGGFLLQDTTSNLLFDGISIDVSSPGGDFFLPETINNVTIRRMGTRATPLDCSSTDRLIDMTGSTTNLRMQRIYVENTINAIPILGNNTTTNVTLENVYTDFDKRFLPRGNNVVVKGCGFGSGSLGSAGIYVDYAVNQDGNFYDLFTAATEGKIGCTFKVPTSTDIVETIAGTPAFNYLGDLLLRTTGDQVVITPDYDLRGHTGFQNIAESISGTSTTNIDREYSISTDGGVTWGTWTTVSGANLSGESISPTGFRIRFRFTANATSSSTLINGFYVETTTTTAAQDNNQYPIEQVDLKITCKDANDLSVISGVRVYLEADSGGALPYQDSVSITRSGSTATVTHTAHGLKTNDKVVIKGCNQNEYNGIQEITVTDANNYTYTVSGTPATPATGTITATSVILNTTTNVSGIATTSFEYISDQPFIGKARKGTSSPYYQSALIAGTITSSGFSSNTFMIGDE